MNPDTSDQTTGTLLPCPFCGNTTKEVYHTEDYYVHVICRACGTCGPNVAVFEMGAGSTRSAAIAAWNKRAVPSLEQEGNDEQSAAPDNSKSSSLTPTAPITEDGKEDRLSAETLGTLEHPTVRGPMESNDFGHEALGLALSNRQWNWFGAAQSGCGLTNSHGKNIGVRVTRHAAEKIVDAINEELSMTHEKQGSRGARSADDSLQKKEENLW